MNNEVSSLMNNCGSFSPLVEKQYYVEMFTILCYTDLMNGGVAMKENLLIDKSIAFASRIIKLHQYFIKTKKEAIISK